MIEEAREHARWIANVLEEELTRTASHRRETPKAPRRDMHLIAVPSLLALLQAERPEPPWYDKASIIIIVVACLIAVVVTVVYPWSWRLLGLGLIAFMAGSGVLFARAIASIYHRLGDTLVALAWPETVWLVRILLVGGAILIIVGCAERLVTRWPGWRSAGKRFAVFAAVCLAVRVALEVAHRIAN